jgi:hypothetical protein
MVEILIEESPQVVTWSKWVQGLWDGAASSNLVVTLSTMEAEYVAGVSAGKEICWMQQLLQEIGFTSPAPSTLFIDNQSVCYFCCKEP